MDWNVVAQYLPLFEKAAWLTLRLGLAGIALAMLSWRACALAPDAVEVSAHDESDHVVLSAHFFAPVTTELAWSVLIDFDHMTNFLPYLKESNVLWRNGNSPSVSSQLWSGWDSVRCRRSYVSATGSTVRSPRAAATCSTPAS